MKARELFEWVALAPNILKKATAYLYSELISGNDSGTLEEIIYNMKSENYLDSDFDETRTNSRILKNAMKQFCKDEIESMYNKLDWFFEGDEINIWRVITAPPNWKPEPNVHPGLYWSWDEHAAEAHWGSFDKDHVQWIMHAKVKRNQIDWVSTLAKNCMPSYKDEKEIEVLHTVSIHILDYHQKQSRY